MIAECSLAMLEKVAELKLSPPFIFGRVVRAFPEPKVERFFLGLCDKETMEQHCYSIEQEMMKHYS